MDLELRIGCVSRFKKHTLPYQLPWPLRHQYQLRLMSSEQLERFSGAFNYARRYGTVTEPNRLKGFQPRWCYCGAYLASHSEYIRYRNDSTFLSRSNHSFSASCACAAGDSACIMAASGECGCPYWLAARCS